jgi:hypothetical protein
MAHLFRSGAWRCIAEDQFPASQSQMGDQLLRFHEQL